MKAVKARFDGRQIILPGDVKGYDPGEVIVVFKDASDSDDSEARDWLRAQEDALSKVWDNPEDAEYDHL